MGCIEQGKKYRIGRTKDYTSIYGYPKKMIMIEDADTGEEVGGIKEEVTPGIPGQPDVKTYYERNGWRKAGGLRFYQSPEALIIANGGEIDTGHLELKTEGDQIEPSFEKRIVKADDATVEARLKALEDKVFLGPTRARRKPKPKRTLRKAVVKKPAKKVGRKVKAAL